MKRRARSLFAGDQELSLVPFDDLFHLVEPEAPPASLRRAEGHEQRLPHEFLGHPAASVGNRQDGVAVFLLDRHRDGPLAVQGLNGVRQEIVDCPHQCFRVSDDWWHRFELGDELDAVRRVHHSDSVPNDARQINRRVAQHDQLGPRRQSGKQRLHSLHGS